MKKNCTINSLVKVNLALTKAMADQNTSLLTLITTITKFSNQQSKGGSGGGGGGSGGSGGPPVDPGMFVALMPTNTRMATAAPCATRERQGTRSLPREGIFKAVQPGI